MLKAAFLTLVFTLSATTHAIPSAFVSWFMRQGEILEVVREVRVRGRALKDPEKLADEIQAIERRVGQPFSRVEIVTIAEKQLREHPWGMPRRFTGRMRVLTPTGYRPLEELNAGDEIYSWDETIGELVLNHVAQVLASAEEVPFGHLIKAAANRKTLEFTGDGVRPTEVPRAFRRLTGIKIEPEGSVSLDRCRESLTRARPLYKPERGFAKVYAVKVQARPFNFVLEGVAVTP